ncbi:hypothetical protein QNA08_12290 [Chelatococcus sp. SYSU_G07232]|uniref:PepSY domain-containing protein n=1 Tax=Chelatococcus albus TaxID=3047466 RepID=A0ABT7AI02_9HYPH|nr:hypothetical protein [Chelatococcus sp. SYSU_G07232]MDJ1159015.1 hypothetical protein [Chelatococcus sp. SYSU_G07232]
MRGHILTLLVATCATGAWAAEDIRAPQGCLSAAETREAVARSEVVPPVTAVDAARAAASGGAKVLRARLCRRDGVYMYFITALRRDGRVVRVRVDGGTGTVASVR